jgi:hypothetical protein
MSESMRGCIAVPGQKAGHRLFDSGQSDVLGRAWFIASSQW